jgi:hypothetical protein
MIKESVLVGKLHTGNVTQIIKKPKDKIALEVFLSLREELE